MQQSSAQESQYETAWNRMEHNYTKLTALPLPVQFSFTQKWTYIQQPFNGQSTGTFCLLSIHAVYKHVHSFLLYGPDLCLYSEHY